MRDYNMRTTGHSTPEPPNRFDVEKSTVRTLESPWAPITLLPAFVLVSGLVLLLLEYQGFASARQMFNSFIDVLLISTFLILAVFITSTFTRSFTFWTVRFLSRKSFPWTSKSRRRAEFDDRRWHELFGINNLENNPISTKEAQRKLSEYFEESNSYTKLGEMILRAAAPSLPETSVNTGANYARYIREMPSGAARIGAYSVITVTTIPLAYLAMNLGALRFVEDGHYAFHLIFVSASVFLAYISYKASIAEASMSAHMIDRSAVEIDSTAPNRYNYAEVRETRPVWLRRAEGVLLILSDIFPVVLVVAGILSAFLIQLAQSGLIADLNATPTDLVLVLLIAAVSGLFSCALLEALKRLLRLRGVYQQRQVFIWLSSAVGDHRIARAAVMELLEFTGVISKDDFKRFLFEGRGRLSARAYLESMLLFDLPIEQLAAQLSDAVEAAIQKPETLPALHLAMIGPIDSIERFEEGRESKNSLDSAIRGRLSVDRIQISVGARWRRYISSAALGMSGLIGLYLWQITGGQTSIVAVSLVATFAGGFLSWFTRDIAAGIERWRKEVG